MLPASAFARGEGFIMPEVAADTPIVQIGCGSIGSWTAECLVRMGFRPTIIDFDSVEEVNIGPQAFYQSDIGKNKAEVLANRFGLDYMANKIQEVESTVFSNKIVVIAVDNNAARRYIYEQCLLHEPKAIIDGSTGGPMFTVRISTTRTDIETNLKLLPPDNAVFGSDADKYFNAPCGRLAIADVAMCIGSKIAYAVRKYVAEGRFDQTIIVGNHE